MSWERPCNLCRVQTAVDFLVDASELLPFGGLICQPCFAELMADDDDAHAGEPECMCRSHCSQCTPGA